MSWPTAALGDVAEVVSGATPKTGVAEYWDGDVYWATPKDLSGLPGSSITGTPRRLTQAGLRSCGATVLPPGSVLLSSRAPIGHVAINTVPMATNQGFKSLMPGERLNAGYLYHWLKAHRAHLENLGNGATFKELSKAAVARIEIPLPPQDKQQRIADILDRADTLRVQRRHSSPLLENLAQSIYYRRFESQMNLSDTVKTAPLGDVAFVSSGITVGRRTAAPTHEVPYLSVSNVQDRRLNLSVVKTIAATDAEIERYLLIRGDLLLTEGGDPDKLGRGSLWRGEIDPCIHQNHVFRVRVIRPDLIDPIYLNWHIGSRQGKAYFLRAAKQTTGIASINLTQLKSFPVRLPPLAEQQLFAAEIASVNRLVESATRERWELNGLVHALQDRAFRGEL